MYREQARERVVTTTTTAQQHSGDVARARLRRFERE